MPAQLWNPADDARDEAHDDSHSDALHDVHHDPRLVAIVEEYQRELDAGRSPDRQALVDRHPELAEAVRECLEGLELVQAGIPPQSSQAFAANDAPPRGGSASGDAAQAIRQDIEGEPTSQSIRPLGDFQIVREIARGGMGIVYEAVQLSLGRKVALKVLPFAATLDSRQLQRFKNEAQAAALLHHTHIVPIHAVGCERGVHFYAMQLIEGQSLASIIEQLRNDEYRRDKHFHPGRRDDAPDRTANEQTSAHLLPDTESRPSERGAVGILLSADTDEDKHSQTTDGLPSSANSDALTTALTLGGRVTGEAYLRRAARLMLQAAEALEHAHQTGVVHRDIKPGNLLVDVIGGVDGGGEARLWITDFGLAQLQAERGLTRSGDFLGTIRYMSPEQTSGRRTLLDHRTDIYSLGATFYELLALQPALPGETHQELLYDILHTEPRSPRHWNRAAPVELETIVLKALSKNPADRYQTAAEMGADIQRFLDNKPILARPPTLFDRARKWSRRHPAVAIAAVILLVVVAAGSLISNRMIAAEQQKTAAALAAERQRALEAEASFQQARRAVDTLFQISQEELADRPLEGARKQILHVVVSYYQDFIEQRRDDPASQAELVQAQNKVKALLEELNAFQREFQLHLLEVGEIREELGISGEKEVALLARLAQWKNERQDHFHTIRGFPDDQRRAYLLRIAEEHETTLEPLLTRAQRSRFKQLAIQSQGLTAFKEPEIVERLDLSREQRSEIRAIEREMFERLFLRPGGPGGAGGPGRPGEPPSVEQTRRDQAEAMAKVNAIFTSQQRREWRQMIGPTFTDFHEGPFFGSSPGGQPLDEAPGRSRDR
jgi:serine/threonine protein kinase